MKRRYSLMSTFATLLFTSQLAADQCSDFGTTAFSCTIEKNRKAVSVCVNNNKIMRYRYGKKNATPELELYASSKDNFDGFYNHGVGRYLWHEATFPNAGYSYAVGFTVDRLDEKHSIAGSVSVMKDGSPVATLICDESSIYNNMDVLY